MYSVQHIQVSAEESGQKLLQFMQRRVKGNVPKSALMRWIRRGEVRVDCKRSKPFARVNAGQTVRFPPYFCKDSSMLPDMKEINPFLLRVVYENKQILVLAKPPNLAVQPGSNITDSVHDRIQQYYTNATWKPALVHRLDKKTSGLLLVAKSYAYLQYLQQKWLENEVKKIYLTWIVQGPDWKEWTKLEDVFACKSMGKISRLKAESECKVLTKKSDKTLLAVKLGTGRKHQIRKQMYLREWPIIGDRKYNGPACRQGLLLHACILSWGNCLFSLQPPWENEFAVPKWIFDSLVQYVSLTNKHWDIKVIN